MKDQEVFHFRAYTVKELAIIYHCSSRTFERWMQRLAMEVGPRYGHFYTPKQVRVIVNNLGRP
jgi:type I restriction-modification system DNA methylase subunit